MMKVRLPLLNDDENIGQYHFSDCEDLEFAELGVTVKINRFNTLRKMHRLKFFRLSTKFFA